MDPKTLQLIVIIVGMVIQFGETAVTNAIVALGKDVITLEDIQALRDLVKPPEKY